MDPVVKPLCHKRTGQKNIIFASIKNGVRKNDWTLRQYVNAM